LLKITCSISMGILGLAFVSEIWSRSMATCVILIV
jgi:hypothetical protein